MVYIPVLTEALLVKGAVALKALLAAKGAAVSYGGHVVAQQAGGQALHALAQGLFGQHAVGLLPALSNALQVGAATLVLGGVTYTVAEVAAYIIMSLREEGYSDAEIRRFLLEQYGIEWS
ncbi:hypothetical protein DPM19_27740 [Actinomadura craniellae]|uniref:Uncharacterized protein n=1 Tax=Actinomadura craniellae TaxID=2231787 RepID=A0A365GY68_9ACTN|nr:hypothetical protein [Actinomadura craniellae]RAY11780.1 hypothetical protein DPM19_27740 [Actinomadura craniellae]